MVSGRDVFRHPGVKLWHAILNKLNTFHIDHEMPMADVMRDLHAAAEQIPQREYAAEAIPLAAALNQASSRRRSGPRQLGELLPELLAILEVATVESNAKGETDLT